MRSSRTLIFCVILSFAVCLLVPLAGGSPAGDLSREGRFTDHLHHPYGVWLFWKHGLSVLSTPFSMLSGEGYPHPTDAWRHTPWMYPPGALLCFAPVTIAAKLIDMTPRQYACLAMIYVILIAHVGLYFYVRACSILDGHRVLLIVIGWLAMVGLALTTFYDALWLGAGALAGFYVRRGVPGRALWAFAAAASLHYRGAVFAPVAALACFQAVSNRRVREWPWSSLAAAAVSSIATVLSFVRMYPALAAHRAAAPMLETFYPTVRFRLVVLISVAAVLALLSMRSWAGAATVLISGVIAISDFRGYLFYGHHAPTVLASPLAVGLGAQHERTASGREIALLWGLGISHLVWNWAPFQLLQSLIEVYGP